MSTTMEVNGLFARINTPAALTGEALNGLPPHCLRPVYTVDEYPACPQNWMHGSAKASSYFVPVSVDRGMWFDFTMNSHCNDIAIVVSVQGVNPVTGKKVTELNLEQYRENCPIHNKPFQQDRFCPDCGYKWPSQNYISTTTGQPLWIDGFRNEKGEVRQYIITEDIARGIAAQVIGEDRVWAIGFAFYLSKEPRKIVSRPNNPCWNTLSLDGEVGDMASLDCCYSANVKGPSGPTGSQGSCGSYGVTGVSGKNKSALYSMASAQHVNCSRESGAFLGIARESAAQSHNSTTISQKTLEIGAGARVDQEIGVDANPIDYWQTEPSGLIYVNYISEKEAHKIILAGRRTDKKDCALHSLKVGN